MRLPSYRPPAGVALGAVLALGAGAVLTVSGAPDLTRDAAFRVLTPRDGQHVGTSFLLTWTSPRMQPFAVVVDGAVPPPGAAVTAGRTVLTLDGNALRLTLGPHVGGSPSARRSHVVVVVPLDAAGRRLGEQTAVVHVRT